MTAEITVLSPPEAPIIVELQHAASQPHEHLRGLIERITAGECKAVVSPHFVRYTVLIAEDNDMSLYKLVKRFRKWGFEVSLNFEP